MNVNELNKVKLVKCQEGYKLQVEYKKKTPYTEIIGFGILILFILYNEFDINILNIINNILR